MHRLPSKSHGDPSPKTKIDLTAPCRKRCPTKTCGAVAATGDECATPRRRPRLSGCPRSLPRSCTRPTFFQTRTEETFAHVSHDATIFNATIYSSAGTVKCDATNEGPLRRPCRPVRRAGGRALPPHVTNKAETYVHLL